MTDTPELDDFKAELRKLKTHKRFRQLLLRGEIQLGKLALADVFALMLENTARYFLLAAANLNRTQLKKATKDPETAIVEKKLRQAHAVRKRLPLKVPFDEVVARAESLRGVARDEAALRQPQPPRTQATVHVDRTRTER
jgi:hypothetical protein